MMCNKPPLALVFVGVGIAALSTYFMCQVHKRVPESSVVSPENYEVSRKTSSVQHQHKNERRMVRGRKFPWMASVRLLNTHVCEALIIDKQWLLTVASCIFGDVKSYSVRVGSNKLKGGTTYTVKKAVLHEGYDVAHAWANDIAVIMVSPVIHFKRGVALANLTRRGHKTPAGTPGVIAGWSSPKYSEAVSNDLRELDVLVYDHGDCKRAYAMYEREISQRQLCAASIENGKGVTNGDSGAPLIVEGKVVGLLSWQRRGVSVGYPAVYTELSHYIDWIEKHTSVDIGATRRIMQTKVA